MPARADAGDIVLPASMTDVRHAPPAPAGVVITALGALIPARSAARLTIAEVLHNSCTTSDP